MIDILRFYLMNSQSFSIVNMVLKILEKDTGVTRTACIRNRCRILFGLLRSIEIKEVAQFMDRYKQKYTLALISKVLGFPQSTYYKTLNKMHLNKELENRQFRKDSKDIYYDRKTFCCTNITYIHTVEDGWTCLASVIDLYSNICVKEVIYLLLVIFIEIGDDRNILALKRRCKNICVPKVPYTTKCKKSFKGIEVLNIPQLHIEKGEVVVFLRKDGSGKSTTIKIISGLLYQDEGDVNVFGITNTSKNIRKQCKLVLESGKGHYDYLTAKDNMKYFLGLNKINYDDIEQERNYYIDMLNFGEHMNKKVSELSQGSRQKLSIIISLLTNPAVLCLDEPTNGLDIITSNFLMSCLTRIANEKILQYL